MKINLKNDSVKEVEKEVKKLQEESIVKAKPRVKKPIYEDITEEEKAQLNNTKVNNDRFRCYYSKLY